MGDFFILDAFYFYSKIICEKMEGITNIKIKGRLDEKWKIYFEGMQIHYEEDDTIFSGKMKDEAFMHGILNKIRDLNLKLISVNTLQEK